MTEYAIERVRETVEGVYRTESRRILATLIRLPGEEAEIEIRQVFEAEDFGPAFTPELQAQEERLRAELTEGKSR
jgi:hypothetical protein